MLCRGCYKSWCTLRWMALSTGFHQQSISSTAALGCILVCSVLFCYVLLDKLAAAFDAILFVDALESLVEHFCSILCFSGQGNAHWQAHRNRYASISVVLSSLLLIRRSIIRNFRQHKWRVAGPHFDRAVPQTGATF